MTSTASRGSSRRRVTTAMPSDLSALEERLLSYLETNLQEIKDSIKAQNLQIVEQNKQVQNLNMTSATKRDVAELERRVEALRTESEVNAQRLRVLESGSDQQEKDRRARPVQTWQVVVGAFSILAVVTMVCDDFIMTLFQLVSLYLLSHK